MEVPAQILLEEAERRTVGVGLTIILIVELLMHPPRVVPVTVYVVLCAGLALTPEDVPELKEDAGDQE